MKRETPIAATVSPITEYVANALAASATSAIISGLLLCAVAACASKHVMNDAANEPIFTPAFFNDEEENEEEVDVDDEAGAYSTSTDDSFANAKTGPTRRLHAWLLFLFFFALKMLLMIFFRCFCALVVVVWVCEESNTKPDEVDIFFVAVERREILIKMRGRRYGGDRGEKEQKRRKKYTDEE